MVVSIPQTILAEVEIFEGDRLLIEASAPNRLAITKKIQTMPSTQRVELELSVLQARKTALKSDIESNVWQHHN